MVTILRLALVFAIAASAPFLLGNQKEESKEGDAAEEATSLTVERKLKEKDEIKLTVFGLEELSISTKIDSSGSVNFPLIGNVVVIGKTATEVAAVVEERLEADYIRDAHVTLSVVEEFKEKEIPKPVIVRTPAPAPSSAVSKPSEPTGEVVILGEIKRPGTVKFEGVEIDLLAVLAQAGGFTPVANTKKVTVRRLGEGGSGEVITVNAGDLQTGTDRFLLKHGDTVSVPKRLF